MIDKNIQDIVEKSLQNDDRARDNDDVLLALVWRHQVGHRIEYMNCLEFLQKFAKGDFFKAPSIWRCRQKLQEENEYLRGSKYDARQKHSKKVKEEIRNW